MTNINYLLSDDDFDGFLETKKAYYFAWPINDWKDWEIVKILKIKPKLMLWEFV